MCGPAEGMVVATVELTDALTVGLTGVPAVAGSVRERGSSFLRVLFVCIYMHAFLHV